MNFIGIDNGASGSIGIITPDGALFEETPTMDSLHFGVAGSIGLRIDRQALRQLLDPYPRPSTRVYLERPFTGSPRLIKTALSARQTFTETVCTLEDMGFGFEVIDSRSWQKPLLGNIKGSPELKKASLLRGIQLYPYLANAIKAHKDADGLLIAHAYSTRSAA